MIEATLYFSDKSRDVRVRAIERTIEMLPQAGFPAATITRTIGLWEGEREFGFTASIVLDVDGDRIRSAHTALTTVAGILAKEFNQNSVGVKVVRIAGSFTLVNPADYPDKVDALDTYRWR